MQSDLPREACVEQLAQIDLGRVARGEQKLAQSMLGRATCATDWLTCGRQQLAQSNYFATRALQNATCVK